MTIFTDPEHVWIAALVASLSWFLSASITIVGVKLLLGQFLKSQRSILQSAILQTESVDAALSIHSQRLNGHDSRLSVLEGRRDEHIAGMERLAGRVKTLEDRRPGQVG